MWFSFILFLFLSLAFLFMSIGLAKDNKIGASVLTGLLSIVSFCALLFFIAPIVIGYGKVPHTVETFDTRLEYDQAYLLVASSQVSEKNYVLLVKKFGTDRFLAIRAEKLPPEIFTLIDGNPVAIVPPK